MVDFDVGYDVFIGVMDMSIYIFGGYMWSCFVDGLGDWGFVDDGGGKGV